MFASRPSVHPVEAPPLTDAAENPAGVRMKDFQGMPGTPGGLALRISQFLFAVASLCVMASTADFRSVTAFRDGFTANLPYTSCYYQGLIVGDCISVAILGEICCFHPVFTSRLRSSYLVAAVVLQSLWSLSLAFVDIYALLVKRSLRNSRAVSLFTIGDGITSTLTFAAACASAGITVLIGNDLDICAQNHCASFETATAMAFISWFAVSPSFLMNFWSLATR